MYYNALNSYLKKEFGQKVYKLSLNGGMSCPNRDGTLGTRGCIFCSGKGSGDFAPEIYFSVSEQIEQAKLKIRQKTDSEKFIAYFQAFTNTYAPVDYLESIFLQALAHPQIVALSIATRPDCLPDEVLKLLDRLNRIKPIWVELGLQTAHENTAEYIRRGYGLHCFDEAVKNLKAIDVQIIAHVILGLPHESKAQMLKTADYVGKSGCSGIKLQLLHVLKGTDLEKDYEPGKFNVLSMADYIDIVCDCIEILPPELVIHRLTGDGPKAFLTAPLWSADKKSVLNALRKEMEKRDTTQGRYFGRYQALFEKSP